MELRQQPTSSAILQLCELCRATPQVWTHRHGNRAHLGTSELREPHRATVQSPTAAGGAAIPECALRCAGLPWRREAVLGRQ